VKRQFSEGFNPTDAALFTWHGKEGCAEASDLPLLRMHQVWQDSIDEGFTVVSRKTGEHQTFVKNGEQRDREGELQATVFHSINNKTGRLDAPAARLTILIFND
jgi:hypothetical protein